MELSEDVFARLHKDNELTRYRAQHQSYGGVPSGLQVTRLWCRRRAGTVMLKSPNIRVVCNGQICLIAIR